MVLAIRLGRTSSCLTSLYGYPLGLPFGLSIWSHRRLACPYGQFGMFPMIPSTWLPSLLVNDGKGFDSNKWYVNLRNPM